MAERASRARVSAGRSPRERPPRYRVDVRSVPFTPSWFWEVIDTVGGGFVENSLARSREVFLSPAEAAAAGRRYVVAAAPPEARARAA